MNEFGKELIDSANEALAIAEGRLAPARVIAPEAIDVAAIRKRLNLNRGKFAARFGLSVATLRDWEQNRRRPDRIAATLLRVIDDAPETVARVVKGTGAG
jgi:putative transcriptional regulator